MTAEQRSTEHHYADDYSCEYPGEARVPHHLYCARKARIVSRHVSDCRSQEATLNPTADDTADDFVEGILTVQDSAQGGKAFIESAADEKHFQSEPLWSGYLQHWAGTMVRARYLPQCDYQSGRPMVLVYPQNHRPKKNGYIALYYNERLTDYAASRFGHVAIDVNGTVFNFSHLLNEDEAITLEEFLYRPSLGEFAPHPETGTFNVDDAKRPYYDKFGRLFMRSVHALVIEGLDTDVALGVLQREMDAVLATPIDSQQPDKYRDFSFLRRSCVTIVRDCLKQIGLPHVQGVIPRDLFVSTANHAFAEHRSGRLDVSVHVLEQLKIDARSYSTKTPLLNPLNRYRAYRLKREFKVSV